MPQTNIDDDGDVYTGEGTPLIGGTPEDTLHDNGRAVSFKSMAMEPGIELKEVCDALEKALGDAAPTMFPGEALDALGEKRPAAWIGGWPHSAQDISASYDDIVLLQVGNAENDEFMWGGDIGCAHFLISPGNLKALRFDRIRYSSAGY